MKKIENKNDKIDILFSFNIHELFLFFILGSCIIIYKIIVNIIMKSYNFI
jgi:hypothetical protein